MKTKIYRAVFLPAAPLSDRRSAPAEVTSAVPPFTVVAPRPLVHPNLMTTAVEDSVVPALTANLTRYLAEGAGTVTNKYVDLLKLAAGS